MADLFDLVATIRVDDTGYSEGINNASSKNDGLSASTIAMGNLMAEAFKKVISVVAEYGQKIIEVGAEQETALAKVNTIMDTNVKTTEEMASGIKSLSSEMGISVTELSDSVYNVISATGDTENALSLAEKASKLATAGFTDTGSAVGVLTTAMNAYHLEADQAEHITDSLITVQNLGVTTVGELSSSMGKAIASASAYGVNLENLESAYISITKAGISTAEGTTYISSMLKELGDSGSDVAGILKEKTGQSFDEFLASGKTLGDALGVLNDSVDGNATALMNLWSSAEAGKASSAIIGQGIDQFNSNLVTLQETTGTTQTAFETMSDTFQHKSDVLKTTFENFGASIFDNISNGLSGGLDEALWFIKDFQTTMELEGEMGGIDYAIALVDNLLLTIRDRIDGVIETGAQAVGKFIQGLTDRLPSIIHEASMIIEKLCTGIGKALPELIPMAVEAVITFAESLVDNVDMLIDGALELILGLADGLIKATPRLLEKAPEIIIKLTEALVQNVPKILMAGLELILALADSLITNLPKLVLQTPIMIKAIFDGLVKGVSEFTQVGKYWIDGLWSGIKEKWSNLVSNVKNLGKNLISEVKSLFGIHSPSKVFANIGEMCVAGLEEGSDELFSTKGLTASVKANVTGTTDIEPNNNRIDDLLALLESYLPTIASGQNIYLDGDTLVSGTAKRMDMALGRLNARRA